MIGFPSTPGLAMRYSPIVPKSSDPLHVFETLQK